MLLLKAKNKIKIKNTKYQPINTKIKQNYSITSLMEAVKFNKVYRYQ